jgi:hypothetical protein
VVVVVPIVVVVIAVVLALAIQAVPHNGREGRPRPAVAVQVGCLALARLEPGQVVELYLWLTRDGWLLVRRETLGPELPCGCARSSPTSGP